MIRVYHEGQNERQGALPRSSALSAVCILESVDSSNTYLANAIANCAYNDARQKVAHMADEPDWHRVSGHCGEVGEWESNPTMALVIPESQTAGRGRLERTWYDHRGQSFLASWALAVPTNLLLGSRRGWLPMAVGMAVRDGLIDVLNSCGATPISDGDVSSPLTLKWPNDIFCDGKKLGGILCEAVPVDEQWSVLVAGLGLNLFIPESDLPIAQSTSLQLDYDGLPDFLYLRRRLAEVISDGIGREFSALFQDAGRACGDLRDRMLRCSWTLGRRVRVEPIGGIPVEGEAVGIGSDASIEIVDDGGHHLRVSSGDVGVLPTPGAR